MNTLEELPFTGRPMVFLSCCATDTAMNEMMEHFRRNGFRTFLFDPPVSRSRLAGVEPAAVDDSALDVLAFLRDGELGDVILVGSCFGGWIAAEAAVRDADAGRVSGLILLGPVGIRRPAGLRGSRCCSCSCAHGLGVDDHDVKLEGRLARVRIPVEVVWDSHDRVIDLEYAQAFARAFRAANLQVIPGSGHRLHADQPAVTIAHIEEYISAQNV